MTPACRLATVVLLAAGLVISGTSVVRAAPRRPATITEADLGGLRYRFVGPMRGGRVTAVTGVPGRPGLFFMGSTGGGVFRTTDGGLRWENVSDVDGETLRDDPAARSVFGSASVGAIAVAPSDPNVVWVGMGSVDIRGNTSAGDGVYRSTDGGETWRHVGLEDAGQIGRIRVHPDNPDVAWVAVLGHAFGPNRTRGVFRTTDGGATWENVLFVSEKAGAVDLALDPTNPRILYAAFWEAVRLPWTMVSGGPGSGLYKSTDGGDSWTRLGDGLPDGVLGKIGVAVSPANPRRVWALVEHADKGGLYRSDDAGRHFRRVSADRNLLQRAWYYTHVYADPRDENTVWVTNVLLWRSDDGGKSWTSVRAPHGDHHDLWIDPDDPRVMINGNDGGANVTTNGGRTWTTQANQPTAEIYRVTVDDRFPYRIYGSQQDNTSLSLPSRTRRGRITRADWYPVGGCESGHVAVDPRDPEITYVGCYGGTISRHDHRTGETREIMAWPQLAVGRGASELRYRFQWNAPIRLSPHDPSILYHCSQFVHRSRDEGRTWEIISPDLTRNDPDKQRPAGGPITLDNTGVEVFDTIFAFEESPHARGELWVGTDDGLVHLSRDDGASWQEITPKEMPEWATVNSIELSPHAPGRAFLAVHRYRLDDFRPYVFRTDDRGAHWTLLTDGTNGIPDGHFVRVVREDPVRHGLLYAGTEYGVYVSFDDGKHWQRLQRNLPVTPVTDMAVRHGDLILSTQGRGFWILDDLTPLRSVTPAMLAEPLHLFEPREVIPLGPHGATIDWSLAETLDPEDENVPELVLEVLGADGEVLRRFSSREEDYRAPSPWPEPEGAGRLPRKLPARRGLNRFAWDLRLGDVRLADGVVIWGRPRGPRLPPGDYRLRLSLGEDTREATLRVRQDPRTSYAREDLVERFRLARSVWQGLARSQDLVRRVRDLRAQLDLFERRAGAAGIGDEASRLAGPVRDELAAIEGELTQPKSEAPQDILNFRPGLDNQLAFLQRVIESAGGRPYPSSYARWDELRGELDALAARIDAVVTGRLKELAAFMTEHDLEPIGWP
ncbi:MAG: glycosyl hydrolase [Acidobacteria bacterium]|nr:MAG: glycosyl hydrolase [Acidobacteriota bacterium]